MTLLKVASRSSPGAVAGAIAGVVRDTGEAELRAIGPHAVNQATKAVAIARTFLAADGLEVVLIPSFVRLEKEDRTALSLLVQVR
ncbi:MAG: stage V sporulation protein S [Anaerolineae bacterium]|nr:stage V sporulation protein S [Anaerolineae bacterium]